MLVSKLQFVIVSTLLLLLSLFVSTIQGHYSNATTTAAAGASTSPWLKKVTTNWPRPRPPWPPGCRGRPWICRRKEEFSEKWPDPFRQRWRCCRDRCVDVSSDVYNCGLCGIRCPFSWQCCGGICSNTNISPFNCGRCGNRCPYGVRCLYGMCGYAEPDLPPWPRPPFPFPPKRPWPPRPPFPFPPKRPWPPRPPFPFPPKRPWPPRPPFPFPPKRPWPPRPHPPPFVEQ